MADETPPPSPKPARRERGYAHGHAGSFWVDLTEETTPELMWPLSVEVFDRMRRAESQVDSVLGAVTGPIMRTQWRIDGTGCDREVTESVAKSFGLPIKDTEPEEQGPPQRLRGRFSWEEHLPLALLKLTFGHSFFEQVYRPDPEASAAMGRDQYQIRKLALRPSRTISEITVARDGGLVSIQQYGSGLSVSTKTPPLPVNRLVAYVHQREGANWLGRSLLRSAYKNWLLKDRALRIWDTSIDRNGVGVPIYTSAEKETSLDAGEELAVSVRSGENAGGAIPYGAKLDLVGVKGQTVNIAEFVRYHDEAIARSALGHFLNLGSQGGGQVGSYNYGSVLAETFNDSLAVIAASIAATANAHVIEDLVDINFGPTTPAPRLVFDEIGTRQSELDRAREAAGLTSDADLVKFLRTISDQEDAA